MALNTKYIGLVRPLIVEFIGDLLLVFIGSLQATSGTGVTGAAFAHGLTIAVLIAGMGHISGGHFNPAVTLGVALSGKIPPLNAVAYVIAQLLGGFVGGFLVRAVLPSIVYYQIVGGATIVPESTTWAQALICEIVLTYILVNTVLVSAVDRSDNLLAPLAIGLSITLDIFAGGNVSGASMNPARSLGPCVTASIFADESYIRLANVWGRHYVYWIGPAIGAAIAALLYKTFLANDNDRCILKK